MASDRSSRLITSILETYFFEDEKQGLNKWENEISSSILSGNKQKTGSLCKFLYEYNEFFGNSSEIEDVLGAYFAYKRFYNREWDDIDTQVRTIRACSTPKAKELSNLIFGLISLYRGELDNARQVLSTSLDKSSDLGDLWWQALIEYCEALRMSGYLLSAQKKIVEVNVTEIPRLLQNDFLLTKGLIFSSVGKFSEADEIFNSLYKKTKIEGDYYRYYRARYYHSDSLRLNKKYLEASNAAMDAENGLKDFDTYRAALAMRYRACSQYLLKNLDESKVSIQDSLRVFEHVGSSTSIAIAKKIEGIILHDLGDLDNSEQSLTLAKELLRESQCKYELFKVELIIAVLKGDKDRYLHFVLEEHKEEYCSVWDSLVGKKYPINVELREIFLNVAM